MDEQQRRRLPRAVVDHVHPLRMLNVVLTHAEDDAWAAGYQSWTNVVGSVAVLGVSPTAVRILPALEMAVVVIIVGFVARDLGGSLRAQVPSADQAMLKILDTVSGLLYLQHVKFFVHGSGTWIQNLNSGILDDSGAYGTANHPRSPIPTARTT